MTTESLLRSLTTPGTKIKLQFPRELREQFERDCGFTEADFKAFPLSVEANQQRLMTNAYYPFDLAAEEAIYRECY